MARGDPRTDSARGTDGGYVGRFAPSPTGELHFGSLVAAVGSYLQARSQRGRWLLRIEDIDPPREVPGSAERILEDLHRFGMEADEPVLYQSQREPAYREATRRLVATGLAFPCGCSRRDIPTGRPYPGTCRSGIPDGGPGRSIRVRIEDRDLVFVDAVHGKRTENLARSCGDFVIRRADGLPAYQLAVVLDDAFQGVTEVVRGADLLDSTPRQIHLQELLGLPRPAYLHLPIATDLEGRKLSKRLRSDPLTGNDPATALRAALRFLGQPVPEICGLGELWDWAARNWRPDRIRPPGTPHAGG